MKSQTPQYIYKRYKIHKPSQAKDFRDTRYTNLLRQRTLLDLNPHRISSTGMEKKKRDELSHLWESVGERGGVWESVGECRRVWVSVGECTAFKRNSKN